MTADTERLFFALWPEPLQQQGWADQARELLPQDCGRLVAAQNLHLTLLYLGEITLQTRQAMEATASAISFTPFVLRLDHFGYWRKPQVVWWGAKATPAELEGLVGALRRGAEACELKVDQRPYQAHLTLARKVKKGPGHLQAPPYDWPVDKFVLVRSVLAPAGAKYEVIRRWPA